MNTLEEEEKKVTAVSAERREKVEHRRGIGWTETEHFRGSH